MKGRSRAYTLTADNPPGKTAISVAFNDRCDMMVATVVLPPATCPLSGPFQTCQFDIRR
jgi:hypothetical protein